MPFAQSCESDFSLIRPLRKKLTNRPVAHKVSATDNPVVSSLSMLQSGFQGFQVRMDIAKNYKSHDLKPVEWYVSAA